MSQGQRAALHADPCRVERQRVAARQHLAREGFVELDHVEVVDAEPRTGKGLAGRGHDPEAGLTLADLDAVELNEAFAGQVLACCDALGLDPHRVCPDGGALGLGHPWGASGAVLVVRLFSQLVRADRGRYGLAAIAVGGGQGVAMVVERCR